ncbi:MAG: class I SAM-dependent methyltransferase [Candidatus Nitrosocosmicus sp.]|nr:class I SAM-dependent methyltransferase [Candidatus Nitrosocosmicus sp.]MDN5867773.1 class I SAM-dependent methyltransferase [Candidatus Nitrosocosmicus sp.]
MDSHNEDVISEFTRQASTSHDTSRHFNDYGLNLMIRFSKPTIYDTVLDVACGNGTVAFEYAKFVNHVTGIDITPAMIERARIIQKESNLDNLDWRIGDISTLPFKDDCFSIVVTRGSLHHLIDFNKVIDEMYRVCKPGGKILITDVTVDKNKKDEFNSVEKMRVLSYTKALTLEDMLKKMKALGAINIQSEQFDSKRNLKAILQSSLVKPSRKNENILLLKPDIDMNNLGTKSQAVDDHVHHSLTMSTVMGIKEK